MADPVAHPRRALPVAACVLAAWGYGAAGDPQAPSSAAGDSLEALAWQLVDLLAAGQFDAATENFDEQMRRALPPEKLKEAWESITAQAGPYQRRLGTRTETQAPFTVVLVTCRFQKAPLDAKVVFDKQRLVAGLFFIPAPPDVVTDYEQPGVTAKNAAVDDDTPVGRWQSVDYVKSPEDFTPGKRSFRGELFLKDFEFMPNGQTSIGWRWDDGWVLHSNGWTKAQYHIRRIGDKRYLFLPWLSGDVVLRGKQPEYYVLEWAGAGKAHLGVPSSPRTVQPIESVEPFDDVRFKDASKLDLSGRKDLIPTLTFNQQTVWPSGSKMPPGPAPEQILTRGMNPGLGVRSLHKRGLTGKGVSVAIIDQPLYPDHPEYAGKIAAYHDVGCGSASSMHGPAVASLLVGAQCGTAPDARVYYVAAPSWKKDAAYYAEGLDWLVERNRNLPPAEKIRVVSVSAAPSGAGSPFDKNNGMWDAACARAEQAGMMVLDCTEHRGFIGPCWYDPRTPESPGKCTPGFLGKESTSASELLLAPTSGRTTAEQYEQRSYEYQYCGRGGLSWAIPYAAGVLALGWQVNPDLSPEQMRRLLFQSAQSKDGAKIIHPRRLISLVRKASGARASRTR